MTTKAGPMPRRGFPGWTAVLLGVALLAGCGRERAARAPAPTPAAKTPVSVAVAPAPAAPPTSAAPADSGAAQPVAAFNSDLKPATGEVLFTSPEAGFTAIFPGGCPGSRRACIPASPAPDRRRSCNASAIWPIAAAKG